MSTHSLAIALFLLLIANEGYGLATVKSEPFVWNAKKIISLPATVFAWWLVLTLIT